MTYEYYLKFWGQAKETILAAGIKETDHWFSLPESREEFKKRVKSIANAANETVVFSEEEGLHTRKRTIANCIYSWRGKRYFLEYDFGYAYPIGSAHYMFEDGNYSCDCNISLFLSQKYDGFPDEMPCGSEIELISIYVSRE